VTINFVRTYLTTRISVRLRPQHSRQIPPEKQDYRNVGIWPIRLPGYQAA
jgi:hypothetical protein